MQGYFLLADILGFKNIIENIPEDNLSTRIDEWISLVKTAVDKYSIKRYSLLSDTLFVSVPSSVDGLESIILMSKYLLEEGLLRSIPLRGAITHGSFEWGHFVYGKAVIDAHNIEKNQNWIGITCSTDIPLESLHWGEKKLICYSPLMKTGLLIFHPVVSWDIPTYSDLCNLLAKKGLVPKGNNCKVSYEWIERINNTIIFRMYKNIIKKYNLSYDEMHGISSMAFLENHIYKALND